MLRAQRGCGVGGLTAVFTARVVVFVVEMLRFVSMSRAVWILRGWLLYATLVFLAGLQGTRHAGRMEANAGKGHTPWNWKTCEFICGSLAFPMPSAFQVRSVAKVGHDRK